MTSASELAEANAALRGRLSQLREASLRANEVLDFKAALQGMLDSAGALTGARYGMLWLLDEQPLAPFNAPGQVQDLLTFGLNPEELRQLVDLPESPELFEHLGGLAGALRVPDLGSHLTEAGLPSFQLVGMSANVPFLGAPIVHRGRRLGLIYLADPEGGRPFATEDEDILLTVSAQAALTIANARHYRGADLETLVETSPVGVAVFDAKTGELALVNREAIRIVRALNTSGRPPEHILSAMTVRRANGEEVSLEPASLSRFLGEGGTVRAEEIVISVEGGESGTALMNATPIRSPGGEIESYFVTLQDMTAVEELGRLRAEFLAMVSHELRTPLTSVIGSIKTLLDPSSALNPAEQYQFHRIINAQTERMRVLISDLLDVARIETGTLSTSPEPTDVAVLVGEASEAFRSSGGTHALQVDIAPNLPWVMADRSRVAQVLSNLLSNAARNSHESSPISVAVVREGIHLVVSVSDEGRGIPAENMPHLFQKFSRPGNEEPGGDTGLGLAICRGIVEAHGGRIWAESDGPGLGARFTFTIPTAEAPAPPATVIGARGTAPAQGVEPERTRILAVDDDPEALRYVRDTLLKAGYDPIVTGDPMEVMRLIREQPQLVLLDLMLPGIDGIELMGEIHKVQEVPVVFLSAYGLEEVVERAFDAGASDYIIKPFTPTELTARIRAALRRRAAPEPLANYVVGDLEIDFAARRVSLAGEAVRLTPIEYRTLAELSGHAGMVVTYQSLLTRVWGLDETADIRPIRTVVSTLRRRLADEATNPRYIITEPRVGYRMAVPDAATNPPAPGDSR